MDLASNKKPSSLFSKGFTQLWIGPITLLAIFFFLHFICTSYLFAQLNLSEPYEKFLKFEPYLFWIGLATSVYWLFSRILSKTLLFFSKTSMFIKHPLWLVVLPFFASVLRILFFLVLLVNLTQRFGSAQAYFLDRLLSVLIIAAISLIFVKLVEVISQLLINQYAGTKSDASVNRKIYTQILIIKRVALSIVIILSIGSILMLFENVRALGASVLTTAGIAGLIITFTAQRSLSSIFAGLEIALAQPIKIGDSVVIENKLGIIEEINFRNVVIKLWDWRRLIVPTNYFLEKPFENWSRDPNYHLIGVVNLSVDFTLPVAELRNALNEFLKLSQYWDKRVGSLEVSDLKERVMELKILASASNPTNAANLQSELREQVVDFIVKKYPQCLPITRSLSAKNPSIPEEAELKK